MKAIQEGDFITLTRYAALTANLDEEDFYEVDKVTGEFLYLKDAPFFPIGKDEVMDIVDVDDVNAEDPTKDEELYSIADYRNGFEWLDDIINNRLDDIEFEMGAKSTSKNRKAELKKISENYMDVLDRVEEVRTVFDEYESTFSIEEIIENGLVS